MIDIVVVVLAVSILLYVLLGGADFGAGIVELCTENKSNDIISKAIAPIWEANHIWLILVVVILFNGFPLVYTSLTTYLHIPLFIILIGIIFRGTAFIFRFYDTKKDNASISFTVLFRLSSLITPFFLGVVMGAIILGEIPATSNGNFYELYVASWFNLFTLSTGIFVTLLCGWLASVYLTGETKDEKTYQKFAKSSRNFFIVLVLSGISIFVMAQLYHLAFFTKFMHSPISICCVIAATLTIPIIWKSIKSRKNFQTRLWAGIQTSCIILGWFAIQFPIMMTFADGSQLTIFNSQAPERTITLLVYALLIGIVIIFPAFIYLFKVFSFEKNNEDIA
jgi:cytochrome d ubiquinol oxidase subunit II